MNELRLIYGELIQYAALLAKGGLLSPDPEDYAKRIPKWLISRIEAENQYLRDLSVAVRKTADKLSACFNQAPYRPTPDGVVEIDAQVASQGESSAGYRAILDLAARLDEVEKRITELELASPCPMLKSICEDWEYTRKLDGTERIKNPIGQPKFGPVLNNAKPQPDKDEVGPPKPSVDALVEFGYRNIRAIFALPDNQALRYQAEAKLREILRDLINEVMEDKGESKEPPEFHDFCERVFVPGTDYRTGDIRMLIREHIDELREIIQRWDAGV